MAGVSMGRYPQSEKFLRIIPKIWFRRSISAGEKSRVPLGMDGFWDMSGLISRQKYEKTADGDDIHSMHIMCIIMTYRQVFDLPLPRHDDVLHIG
jgi:hypothetical protein